MIKLSIKELNEIKKDFTFYDFINHNSTNGQILIKFNDNVDVTRFDDIQLGGLSENFIKQANILKGIVLDLIDYLSTGTIVITKYQYKWIMNKSKSPALAEIFHTKGLRANFSGAISVNEKKILEDFTYSNFKYNSFTHFLIPNANVMITPTDHLDLFIAASNIENTLNIVRKIIDENGNDKVLSISKI